ncbi:MAG: formate/nitrite transporter family protein [Janthinobacterium lividum]
MAQDPQDAQDAHDSQDAAPETNEAGQNSPHLDESEKTQAADHSSPHALILHEIVREEGEAALERDSGALMWSALAAGLSMGFSFIGLAIMRAYLPHAHWTPLVASFGYSIGFVIVVLGKQQLFTESTLTVVLPVLTRRDWPTLKSALRVWIIVLVVNLIGTAIFAALLTVHGLFEDDVVQAMHEIAGETVAHPFGLTFLKALLAGWLIALMVWLLPSARSGRLITVMLITYVVAVAKLSHIIAGSVEASYGVMTGVLPISAYFGSFLLPTLLGNVLGGISLVGLLNHAAIAPEIRDAGH